MALGANFYKVNKTSIHAEIDAVGKLRTHEKKKKMKPIILISLRFSRSGALKNAKPCYHCVTTLKTILNQKNYCVSYVVYSNSNGELVTAQFDDLLNDGGYITRGNKNN